MGRKGGGLGITLVLALVIYFIITEPRTAAGVVHSLAGTLREAADSITTFFRAVV